MNCIHCLFKTAMNVDITHFFTNVDITHERRHKRVYTMSFQTAMNPDIALEKC